MSTVPDFDAIPARSDSARPQPLPGVVVLRFDEPCVTDVGAIRAVAGRLATLREAGHRVIGVLAAMGSTTSELLELARAVSPRPHDRELDMLVSMGERASCALTAMALVDLGHVAISLTGSQAGIVTDTAYGSARIVDVRPRRIQEELDRGAIVLVAGSQGVSTDGEVTTLGESGLEATALALARALGADVEARPAAS